MSLESSLKELYDTDIDELENKYKTSAEQMGFEPHDPDLVLATSKFFYEQTTQAVLEQHQHEEGFDEEEFYEEADKQWSRQEAIQKNINTGMPNYMAMGYKEEHLEFLYSNAYEQYKAGRYEDAAAAFKDLIYLNIKDYRFVMGLGSCLHRLKKYQDAVIRYVIAATIEPKNPYPFYYSIDCALQENDLISALVMVTNTIKICGKQKKHQELKESCKLLRKSLKKQEKAQSKESKKGKNTNKEKGK